MSGYFGTDMQIALQKAADAAREWVRATPGACDPARCLGSDDPDRLGWDRILSLAERDGMIGFRLIRPDQALEARRRLEASGFRLDLWNVFIADATAALPACGAVTSRPPPAGTRLVVVSEPKERGRAGDLQRVMAECGVAPVSGERLAGRSGPAVTLALADDADRIIASAHAYFAHNAHSRHHRSAWAGLVAVAPEHRGAGLGGWINAAIVERAFRDLDARTVHELVSDGNDASRRMVESSGLRIEPGLVSGLATRGSERFTR